MVLRLIQIRCFFVGKVLIISSLMGAFYLLMLTLLTLFLIQINGNALICQERWYESKALLAIRGALFCVMIRGGMTFLIRRFWAIC